MRTCVGCRTTASSTGMVRVARDAGGKLYLSRHLSGRGAWLCGSDVPGIPAPLCLEQAARKQAFGRAFRVPVTVAAVAALHETCEERARIKIGGAAGAVARRD